MPLQEIDGVSYDLTKGYVGTHNLATMILLPESDACVLSAQKIDMDFVLCLKSASGVSHIQ